MAGRPTLKSSLNLIEARCKALYAPRKPTASFLDLLHYIRHTELQVQEQIVCVSLVLSLHIFISLLCCSVSEPSKPNQLLPMEKYLSRLAFSCLPFHRLLCILPIMNTDIKRKSPCFDLEVVISSSRGDAKSSPFWADGVYNTPLPLPNIQLFSERYTFTSSAETTAAHSWT